MFADYWITCAEYCLSKHHKTLELLSNSPFAARAAENVNPIAVEAMKAIGIDISDRKPKKLSKEMILEADLAITIARASASPIRYV